MTTAQKRLLEEIQSQGGDLPVDDPNSGAEYWPVVNDWVKDKRLPEMLVLHNINRTVAVILREGYATLNDDGYFHLTEKGKRGVK